jgi:hypothetical protein
MLARIKATQIGRTGLRFAIVLAGSQLTVVAAKVGEQPSLAGDCGGKSAFQLAATMSQTVWSMLDACLVGQLVHAAGSLLASDSTFNPISVVAGVIGHELVGHLVSFVLRVLS